MPVNPQLSTYNDIFNTDLGNRLKVSKINKTLRAPGTDESETTRKGCRSHNDAIDKLLNVPLNDPFRNIRSEQLTTETISVYFLILLTITFLLIRT
jgi:hypothetical protein